LALHLGLLLGMMEGQRGGGVAVPVFDPRHRGKAAQASAELSRRDIPAATARAVGRCRTSPSRQ
jgi:hypothetical protein